MSHYLFLLPVVLVVIALAIPARFDPAIRWKERQIRAGTHPESSPEIVQQERDIARINANQCPDCGAAALLQGPSGGMSMNIACNACLSEFNAGFGFGTGAFLVDRSGKLTEERARYAFGIQPDEYRAIVARMEMSPGEGITL